MLDIANWAHHSWLPQARPARNERARAAAAAHLLERFPLLAEAGVSQMPWFAARLSRPAGVRLMCLCAALACARTLRLVVSASARARFFRTTGLPNLSALQCHPRGDGLDLELDEPVDFFDRRSLCVAGLALALRSVSGEGQYRWVQLRLPRDCAEAAAHWRLPAVSPQAALELIGDAASLLAARRTSC